MSYDRINELQAELKSHPLYRRLSDLEDLRFFMSRHVFAVWDFMTLLKSLQRRLTCVEIPWIPSPQAPELGRLINEIVLGEESDLAHDGRPLSHFALYLEAMREIGADTGPVLNFLEHRRTEILEASVASFVQHNLEVALNGHDAEVAAVFFYGRESLVPQMFQGILEAIEGRQAQCPALVYYFRRHIEVDGGQHSHQAKRALELIIGSDEGLKARALGQALRALELRRGLWDGIWADMPSSRPFGQRRRGLAAPASAVVLTQA